MGTSLSGLDAAMAVAIQHVRSLKMINNTSFFTAITQVKAKYYVNVAHGYFTRSRFLLPIPYEPLHIVTDQALNAEIQKANMAFWIGYLD